MASLPAAPAGPAVAALASEAQPEAARRDPAEPPLEFPGCRAVRITRAALDDYEGRFEYWNGDTETAWVVREPVTVYHEGPGQRLAALLTRIAAVRGAPIVTLGTADLALRDARGERRRIMQADQMVYLDPAGTKPPGPWVEVGTDHLPDVVLEVDYSTDVRRGKLGLSNPRVAWEVRRSMKASGGFSSTGGPRFPRSVAAPSWRAQASASREAGNNALSRRRSVMPLWRTSGCSTARANLGCRAFRSKVKRDRSLVLSARHRAMRQVEDSRVAWWREFVTWPGRFAESDPVVVVIERDEDTVGFRPHVHTPVA